MSDADDRSRKGAHISEADSKLREAPVEKGVGGLTGNDFKATM